MKRAGRVMGLIAAFAILALLGLAACVRLAPTDATDWNTDPTLAEGWTADSPSNEVIGLMNGALLRVSPDKGEPARVLARLDTVAMATPRTQRVAGSIAARRITWVTRSALWGFPDYTTAEARDDGLYVYARQRFGKADLGVNSARLREWFAKL